MGLGDMKKEEIQEEKLLKFALTFSKQIKYALLENATAKNALVGQGV